MRYNTILFDFDGTLCDTGKGVIKSAIYALKAFGYEVPQNEHDLEYFVGPPLLVTFQEKHGADASRAGELVTKFRSRYAKTGIFESDLYDGIEELLQRLKSDGIKIGIASSKPQEYICTLLSHLGIEAYFDAVCGVSFAHDCESKASIIARCMKDLSADTRTTLMVGDKKYDIEGAKTNYIDSAAVPWGYGTKFEAIEAGATFLAEKPSDIEAIALGFFEQTEEYSGIYNGKIITVHCDTVTLPNGKSDKREIVDHPGGVAVAGITESNEILLVRQFRYAYKEIVYEIPAGKLEKGEFPYDAGVREFEEECGARAENIFSLGTMYPTPGYCNEIIYLYGATNITFSEQNLDEDEFLDIVKMPFDTAVEKIMNGEIKDSKTIIAIMKLKEMKNNENLPR